MKIEEQILEFEQLIDSYGIFSKEPDCNLIVGVQSYLNNIKKFGYLIECLPDLISFITLNLKSRE